jgi:hypothetical protein
MKHFLIVYDRPTGKTLELKEFSEAEEAAANAARFEWELRTRAQPEIEVVVLDSDSLQTIQRTHARYFKSFPELVQDLIDELAGLAPA